MPYTFSPPTEWIVPQTELDAPPLWNRLLRYYPPRARGRAVWKLADSSFSFDQPYPMVPPEAAHHSDLFTDPARSNLTAVTYLTVYYGGHSYLVDDTEANNLSVFLTTYGYTPAEWLVPA